MSRQIKINPSILCANHGNLNEEITHITEAGADYIKTSTGLAGGGATPHDIMLFAANIGPGVKIKASGGIRTIEDARTFINLGASRVGSSQIVRGL